MGHLQHRAAGLLPVLLFFMAGGFMLGCDRVTDPPGGAATWVDLGTIPGTADIGGLVVVGEDVLLGTDQGLWRRPLDGSGAWVRSGLDGLYVNTVRTLPGAPGTVLVGGAPMGEGLLPFYRSEDGGQTWTGSGEGLYDEVVGYAAMADLVVQQSPGGDAVLYANMLASSIARSRDGGQTWQYVRGQADSFGYPCLLHIRTDDPETLYQGCEEPLDEAWIRAYGVADPAAPSLGEGTLVVGDYTISNRRINGFASASARPGRLYAGLEGALIEIDGDEWRWLWRREDNVPTGYTYVKVIWIDPADPEHLVFGGGDGDAADRTRAGLYETFDGGRQVIPLEGPAGVDFTVGGVRAGAAAGPGGEDLVLATLTEGGVRVLVRQPVE